MKAEESTVGQILTDQICYEIPPYQRPYSWKVENVQQLLEDVWEAYENSDEEYFIGSLITIEIEKGKRYEVVDGQQRLTTLNLILARLRDHIEDSAAKAVLGKRVLPRNELTGETETPRLLLRRKDQSFFRRHVLDSQPFPLPAERSKLNAPQQRIIENLEAIDSFLGQKGQQKLKLFANYLLMKVYVVFVKTESLKSAYRLFNVLNARGMSLSNADLIKNTLFSELGSQQNLSSELEDRWLELEEIVGIELLDGFLSHHRTSLMAAKARSSLHEEYRPIIEGHNGGTFVFLDQVILSARNFMRIWDINFQDAASARALNALWRVSYDEWIPPLLAYLNQPVDDLTEAQFLSLLERITMQNWVRRLGHTARLTAYFKLINAIKAGKSSEEVGSIFITHANNDEFINLLGGEIYGKSFDAAVLLRLEEASQDDSVTKTFSGRLTIEHVMPQALKDTYWKDRFSSESHGLWLHRLGNLAMLSGGKNYKAQYFDFDRKKKIYLDRDKKVSFDLTKEICNVSEWSEDALKARQERLIKLAKETWSIA
ncbi:DUF262 domain-containing HNH endonuclease family protein [Pseudomonas sp. MM211]|uniref:DUF262 domain-containing protein n=1 Tax=Pseudomonas sp. MM211 TaxID=2866808 RepID=UPI001CED394F|nr:DUF262 domain-containing protein [Pseudomonas sp. MM211]UCJ18222.1 DUF262 domain-containing HNH endonuclease family protein [Pseudomonas sp. MM211]